MSDIYFQEIFDPDIPQQYADFLVENISYTISFTYVVEGSLDFDEVISRITQGKKTYAIEFLLSEIFYDPHYQGDFYTSPVNNTFSRNQYRELRNALFSLITQHYKQYNPDCYFIVADRRSLQKMYEKMCKLRTKNLLHFKPIIGLGLNGECFLILTPSYE